MDRKLLQGLGLSKASKEFDVGALGDMLEEAYLAGRRKPSKRAKSSFSPSNIGYGSGTCPRRWFYDFNGGVYRQSEQDAMGIASMAYGTEAHERIQGLFETSGKLLDKEFELRNESPPIYGYVDLLVEWQGEEVVGEIKTTLQESFVHKRNTMKPAGYHLLQLLIYMKVLGKDKGFLLYENKNNQQLLAIPVEMNKENSRLVDDTFEWMKMVHDNAMNGELPTRPYSPKSIPCKSCDYREHCWKDDDGVVDLPKLEVPK